LKQIFRPKSMPPLAPNARDISLNVTERKRHPARKEIVYDDGKSEKPEQKSVEVSVVFLFPFWSALR
jgi:hypothetical protein